MLEKEYKKYIGFKPEKVQYHWDETTAGFGLKINPSGNHRWVGNKHKDGKRLNLTFGSLDLLTYKQAYEAFMTTIYDSGVAEMIRIKREGKDSPTFKEMIEIYAARHLITLKSGKEMAVTLRSMAKKLPDIKLKDLTTAQLEDLRVLIPSHGSFNRSILYASSMWNHADKWGILPKEIGYLNPCSKVALYKIKPRKKYLKAEAMQRFMRAVEQEFNLMAKYAIQLILLTGARKTEALSLRWSDIDIENATVTFVDTKNGEDHVIPLTDHLYALFKQIPRLENTGNYVFPSDSKEGHLKEIRLPFERMKRRAGVDMDLTIHDLRRSVSCYLIDIGVPVDHVGGSLGHKTSATTRKHYWVVNQGKKAAALNNMGSLFKGGRLDPAFFDSEARVVRAVELASSRTD
jgi:integrase